MAQALHRVEWVRPTHQARSQETLERILEAAEEVVAEKGFDSATVSEIVRRAKSSVGAMYARFTDKESLLACLHERFCEEALATSDAALEASRWEGASIAEIMSTAMPFLVHIYHQKQGLLRAFILRASHDDQFAERGVNLGREISQRLVALLMARRDEIRHPNPEMAVDFGLRMAFDTLDQSTLFPSMQRTMTRFSPELLGEELVRVFLSYLGIEPAPTENGAANWSS